MGLRLAPVLLIVAFAIAVACTQSAPAATPAYTPAPTAGPTATPVSTPTLAPTPTARPTPEQTPTTAPAPAPTPVPNPAPSFDPAKAALQEGYDVPFMLPTLSDLSSAVVASQGFAEDSYAIASYSRDFGPAGLGIGLESSKASAVKTEVKLYFSESDARGLVSAIKGFDQEVLVGLIGQRLETERGSPGVPAPEDVGNVAVERWTSRRQATLPPDSWRSWRPGLETWISTGCSSRGGA